MLLIGKGWWPEGRGRRRRCAGREARMSLTKPVSEAAMGARCFEEEEEEEAEDSRGVAAAGDEEEGDAEGDAEAEGNVVEEKEKAR